MNLRFSLLVGLCLVAPPIAAACGGQVVFVEDDDGSGGTTSTSTSKSTSVVGPTGKSSAAQSTVVGPTSGVTSVVTTGPGGGTNLCQLGEFSGACSSCVEDASQFRCGSLLDACANDEGCLSFSECISSCNSQSSCCTDCHVAHPGESVVALYELLLCMYCDQCSLECQSALPGFCGG